LPPFLKRQSTWLLKETGWKTNLPNVMHKTTEIRELLSRFRKA
jgi:hypothetical protein